MDVDANTQDKEIHTDDETTINVKDNIANDNILKKFIDANTNLTFTTVNNQSENMEENITNVDIRNKFNDCKDSIKRKLSGNDIEISEIYSKKIKFSNCEPSGISFKNKEELSDLNNGNKTRIVESPNDICRVNIHSNKNSLLAENSLNEIQLPNNKKDIIQNNVKENQLVDSDVKLLYEKVIKIIGKIDSENAKASAVEIVQNNVTLTLEKVDINERITEAVNNVKDTNVEIVSSCVEKNILMNFEVNKHENGIPQANISNSQSCEMLQNIEDDIQIESLDNDCVVITSDTEESVNEESIIQDEEKISKVLEGTRDGSLLTKVINEDLIKNTNVVSQIIIENIKNDFKEIITVNNNESVGQDFNENHESTIIGNNEKEKNSLTHEKIIDKMIEKKINIENDKKEPIEEPMGLDRDNEIQKKNQNNCSLNCNETDIAMQVTNLDNDTITMHENLLKLNKALGSHSESLEDKAGIKIESNLEYKKDSLNTDIKINIIENQKLITVDEITEVKDENKLVVKEENVSEIKKDVETKVIINNDINDVVIITDDEDDEDDIKSENLSISTKSFNSVSDDTMKKFCADNTVEDSDYNIPMDDTHNESTKINQCNTQLLLNTNNDDNKIINKNTCMINNKGTSTPNSKSTSTHSESNVFNITPIKKLEKNSSKTNDDKDLDCNNDTEMQEIHDTSTDSTNCTMSDSDECTERPMMSDIISRYKKFVKKYNDEKLNLQHPISSNLQSDTKSNDCLLGTETSEDNLYEINIVYEENEMHSLNIEKINMKKLSSLSKRTSSNGSVTSLGQFQLPSKTTISSLSSSSGSGIHQPQSRLSAANLSPSTSLSASSIKPTIRTSDNQKTYDGKFVIPQLPKKIRQTIRGTLALCNFMIEHFNKLKQINKSNTMNLQEIENNENEDTISVNESNFDSDCSMSPLVNKNNNSNITSPTDFENDGILLNNNINTRQIGNIVLARWNDRKYYSGTIQNILSNNRYMILFDDNAIKTLSKKYLLFSYNNVLPLIDQNIHIINKPNTSELGLVISYNFNRGDNKVYYTVMTEGSTCIVTSSDIFLSEDQIKIINQNLNSTVNKLCNDLISISTLENPVLSTIIKPMESVALNTLNLSSTETISTTSATSTSTSTTVISNGRVTRSRRVGNDDLGLKIKSPQAGFSGGIVGRRKRPTKRQQMAPTTFSESSDISDSIEFDSAPNSPDSALEAVEGVQPELQKTPRESEISKRNLIADFMGNDDSRLEELLGPIVTKKTLFKNKHFLLTCTIPIKKRSNNPDEMKFSPIPYYKDYLIKQIEAGGGKVHNHFEDVPNDVYKKCKLIAPYPCVTAKYIQCLACDIPAVSHEWIIKCCQRNNLIVLKQFLLPSGWSVVNETYIRWIPGKTGLDQRMSKIPFVGVKILIASHNKDFVEFWNRVCKLNGATVNIIKNMNDITKNTKGYMLTDQEFSQDVKIKAEHFGIEIVSTVWIVENLIVGKIIPPNTNKKLTQIYQDDDY